MGAVLEATLKGPATGCAEVEWEDGWGEGDSTCVRYEYEQGSIPAHLVLTTGLLTTGISGLVYWSKHGKRSRPTKNYQTVEVPLETRENKQTGEYLLDVIPAISAPVEIASSYFTLDDIGHTLTTKTNVMGDVRVQLHPSSQNFAFTLDQIAEIDAAQQLHDAGYKVEQYLPLLEQAAVPVSYDVHLQTKATDGKNANVTIPVKGYELSQKALEQAVMGL